MVFGDKPYLIAEIGINHNGDINIAKKLIDATFACSWDCVKFQKRNPEVSIPVGQRDVEKDTPWGKMTYLEYKKKLEFGKEEYDYIDSYCKAKPVDWTASVWDRDSLEFLQNYTIPFVKIPSARLTDRRLIKEACAMKIPVIVSTGMSSLEDIDEAVNILEEYATADYVLMHCNSSYPAKLSELNLNMIPELKKRYNCKVGYSGHEYGLDSTTIAVALGAAVIERHVTLDRLMWGTDQICSVEIQGMDKLYKQVHAVKSVLGDGKKCITEDEKIVLKKLRGYGRSKSIHGES